MARLSLMVAMLAIWPASARAQGVDAWSPHIREAAARFGVPEIWIRRVMRAESGGRTRLNDRPIVSRAGALGLMQLMPGTWSSLRARLDLGSDPHHPRDNILAGTFYLRMMHDQFGYPGLFAAYNAGPGRFARHLATGRPLPSETIRYVAALTREGGDAIAGPPRAAVPPQPVRLFARRTSAPAAPAAAIEPDRAQSIFVIRLPTGSR